MKTNKSLGVALWGLGRHARKNLLPAIQSSELIDLAGVYTRNHDNAKQAVGEYGGVAWKLCPDMLRDPTVDAVYIATPTGLHFEQCQEVLNAGKHLICEKALTDDPRQSQVLIQLAKEKNRVLCEAFMHFYHPQFHKVMELIQAPSFGKLLDFSCHFGIPKLDNPGFRNSRELGGGAFLDVGSYTFFTAVTLLGKLPTELKVEIEYQDGEVDRSGFAHLRFGPSLQGCLTWGYHRAYRAELMVWGEGQSLYADRIFSKNADYVSSVLLRDLYGKEDRISIKPANSFVEMFKSIHAATYNQIEREALYDQAERQAKIMKMALDAAEVYR
jgi:predicted dehydrogenase